MQHRKIFRNLRIGDHFRADGYVWRKRRLELRRRGQATVAASNAEEIGHTAHRRHFAEDEAVQPAPDEGRPTADES
jgi:hypothetical protein